jgi:hypothetical protein
MSKQMNWHCLSQGIFARRLLQKRREEKRRVLKGLASVLV